MPKKTNTTTKDLKRVILLDSHAILHRAYHALPDFMSSKGEPTGGLYGLATMILKIIEELKPHYVIATYDLPQATYRHEAYADYKAGRAKIDENLVAQIIRSRDLFQAFSIPIYDKPGFEADDMLGTIAEKLKKDKNVEVIIASGDMDTMQLVDDKCVQVYTLRKGIKDTILYDEDAVALAMVLVRNFYPISKVCAVTRPIILSASKALAKKLPRFSFKNSARSKRCTKL
jgi:DNA polymerase-1